MFIVSLALRHFATKWRRFALFIGLTALLCIAAGLLGRFFLTQQRAVEPVSIVLVDLDDTTETRMGFQLLSGMESYSQLLVFEKQEQLKAQEMLRNGLITAVVTIPQGFTDSIKSGVNTPFRLEYSEKTPLKSQLVAAFAQSFAEMLKTSQAGVYTALEYGREQGDDTLYPMLFQSINLEYLRLVGYRDDLFIRQTLSVTASMDAMDYYILCALVFLLGLSPVLLLESVLVLQCPGVTGGLRRAGIGNFRSSLALLAALWAACLCVGGSLSLLLWAFAQVGGLAFAPTFPFFAGLAVILLAVAAATLLIARLLPSPGAGSLCTALFSLAALLVSGGIIPTDYLSPRLQLLGRLTLNRWAVPLLGEGLAGRTDWKALGQTGLWALLLFITAVALAWLRSKKEVRG
ncbi:ABC transporter permease [Oscillospiraceae bacterium MB08-C2-2]|nr:ABC transporter permease [Oscillospiraceae bacterium MB08-C2-2]